ncbi:MAG: rRNA pseudouridine synthase [Alphaproteobacteria bacterium]|nr:MAG: rRNA pseudouridine synthase [Alphaproteobacteria bacterium]
MLARAGVCSRRDAEKMIDDGRVAVNGEVLTSPAFKVTEKDKITVDDKPVGATEPTRLWRYHKPAGLVTTHKDPEGRPTVFAALPKDLPRVVSVGRLDVNSEGILLLTNDGALARRLELPKTGWLRKYRARVFGKITQDDLDRLTKGVTIEGVKYKVEEAVLERVQKGNAWISLSLREGKNREVKRLMEFLGAKVNRLIRVSYGPFQLGNLPEGQVDEVGAHVLREQLGVTTAKSNEGFAKRKPARRGTKASAKKKTTKAPAQKSAPKPKKPGKAKTPSKPKGGGWRP